MTDLRKAAEMALEAWSDPQGMPKLCKAFDALREALAQPEQEPVAWRIKVHKYDEETDESSFPWEYHHIRGEGQPLYLHPAPTVVKQEPVAECKDDGEGGVYYVTLVNTAPIGKLYAHPAPIPEGWQLVPIEPTEEMVDKGAQGMASFQKDSVWPNSWDAIQVKGMRHDAKKAYRYMLAAAPKPE